MVIYLRLITKATKTKGVVLDLDCFGASLLDHSWDPKFWVIIFFFFLFYPKNYTFKIKKINVNNLKLSTYKFLKVRFEIFLVKCSAKKKLDFLTKIHMQHVFYFSFFLLIFYVDVPISFITKAFVEYSSASKEIHTSDTWFFFLHV